jgi:hypothetical protein
VYSETERQFNFSASIVERYTDGHCHALALALHRLAALPMIAVIGEEGGELCVAHVMVAHPSSMDLAIDVRGVRPVRDIVESYYDLHEPFTRFVTEADIDIWVDVEDRLERLEASDMDAALALARRILNALGIRHRA